MNYQVFTPEALENWSEWWAQELRSIPTSDILDEIAYSEREIAEREARGLTANPDWAPLGDYTEGLRVRVHLLRWEKIRRAQWKAGTETGPRAQLGDFAHELKARLDFPAWVRREFGVDVHRSGNLWIGLCPIHPEQTPSFTVYPDGHWWCYGHNDGGDCYDLLLATGRTDRFREAVRMVADYLGVAMPGGAPRPIWERYAR